MWDFRLLRTNCRACSSLCICSMTPLTRQTSLNPPPCDHKWATRRNYVKPGVARDLLRLLHPHSFNIVHSLHDPAHSFTPHPIYLIHLISTVVCILRVCLCASVADKLHQLGIRQQTPAIAKASDFHPQFINKSILAAPAPFEANIRVSLG